MESQPQNPEFRDNPENFHPCQKKIKFQLTNVSMLLMGSFRITVNCFPLTSGLSGACNLGKGH